MRANIIQKKKSLFKDAFIQEGYILPEGCILPEQISFCIQKITTSSTQKQILLLKEFQYLFINFPLI